MTGMDFAVLYLGQTVLVVILWTALGLRWVHRPEQEWPANGMAHAALALVILGNYELTFVGLALTTDAEKSFTARGQTSRYVRVVRALCLIKAWGGAVAILALLVLYFAFGLSPFAGW